MILVPGIIVLTSVLVLAIGACVLRLPVARLAGAIGVAFEVIGAIVCFMFGNLLVGLALVLVLRRLDVRYYSLYEVIDLALLLLSVLQALTFYAWRARASR